MATSKLKIENGFFVRADGLYIGTVEPTHAILNGWECFVEEDGTVVCYAERDYSDGIHSIRYVLQPNGFAKLTLKVPRKRVKTLRKGFVVPKGTSLNGTIGLAGGYIDDRYAYFRDSHFQGFLDAYGITAIRHEDPNQTYAVRNDRYGGGECSSELYTDGKRKWVEPPITYGVRADYFEVAEATWALHTQVQHEGNCHNCFSILYTLEKDPTKLAGLPTGK